jgi:predicted DNA-binding WGR domain protein
MRLRVPLRLLSQVLVSANKQAEEAQSTAAAGANTTRRFQLVEGSTAKFWEVEGAGGLLTVRYGKLGTTGQAQTKDLGSVEAVSKQMEQSALQKRSWVQVVTF